MAFLNFSKLYLTCVTKLVAILEGHIEDYVMLVRKDMALLNSGQPLDILTSDMLCNYLNI